MKNLRMIVLLTFLLGLIVAPSMAQTQEFEHSGVLAIPLAEGSTIAYAPDGETLLLSIVSPIDFAPGYVITEDGFVTANYPFVDLEGDWTFAEDLTAEAVLELWEERYTLIIGAPTYDFETGTLTYVVLDIVDAELDKDGLFILPDIAEGSLMIRLTNTFLDGLLVGQDARLASSRNVSNCGGICGRIPPR